MLSEKELFLRSLELSAKERTKYLDIECAGNRKLAVRVKRLISAHQTSADFLESLPDDDSNRLAERLRNTAPSDEVPGEQIGRYRLLEVIGEGSWGTVWIAQQTEDVDRRVAIKILKRGMDTKDFLTRFESERQVLALMDHPNIARVIDAGSTNSGRPYLVMELVKGVQILEFADKNRLGIRERVKLFAKACRAMHHAHRKGVVHRDLKPSNILVSSQYDEALPKVIDFGVAKSNQFHLKDKTLYTSMHAFVGTPVYSSPEQLEFAGRDLDARSDIYSLGALLYELLCGAIPHECEVKSDDGLAEFVRRVKENEAPRPSRRFAKLTSEEKERIASYRRTTPAKLESLLADDLDWIILKCMEKAPSSRYETAKALADDLQAFLDSRTVLATRPSAIKRIRKLATSKRPAYAIWFEAAAVFAVIWVIAFYWLSSLSPQPPYVEKSIAVLPLENLSPDLDNAFFADGVQEDLISNLSKIRELLVIGRSSTLGYKQTTKAFREIGEELGVRYLVEGSVRRAGKRVQVNARLIDSLTGGNIWADNYNRSLDDIFAIQADVAMEIAAELEAVLTPEVAVKIERRPTENQEAYDYYVKANQGGGSEVRITLYKKAVELDPNFAEAWAYLAWHRAVYWKHAKYRNDPDLLSKVHHAMDQALRINPNLPHVLHAQSNLALIIQDDYEQSIDYLLKALEIDPNFVDSKRALALRYRNIGRLAEAQHYFEATLRADPLSRGTNKWLIDVYLARKLWKDAKPLIETNLARSNEDGFWSQYQSWADYGETGDSEAYATALSLSSRYDDDPFIRSAKSIIERAFPATLKSLELIDWPLEWGILAIVGAIALLGTWEIQAPLIWFELGSRQESLKELDKAKSFLSNVLENDTLADPLLWSNLAICHALEGDHEKMEFAIEKSREQYDNPGRYLRGQGRCESHVAVCYLVLDEHTKSIEILERASQLDNPFPLNRYLDLWFIFDRLRGNPRFDALLTDV